MDDKSENVHYIHVRNQSNLSFKGMWNRDDLSDVKILCDNQVFKMHRCLLAACSPYFRATFRQNRCEQLEITIDVSSSDLRNVLKYMYEGSISIKDEDLQGFGELLERFWMPLPDEMGIEDDSSEFPQSSVQNHDSIGKILHFDEFIEKIRNLLNDLTQTTIEKQSSVILDLVEGSPFRLDAVINIILQSVVKLQENCASFLLSSLVICLCKLDSTKTVEQKVQDKSQQVLKYLANTTPSQRKPIQLPDDIISLDKSVIHIQTIEYNWDSIRKRRLTHFLAQLFASNIISYTDIYSIKASNASLATALVDGSKIKSDCCDIEVSADAKQILSNNEYKYACQIENHLYWLRIENNQHKMIEFNGIASNEQSGRNRRRNRAKKSSRKASKTPTS